MSIPSSTPVHREIVVEDDRTGVSRETLQRAYLDHLEYSLGKRFTDATARDRFHAVALLVRDRVVQRWTQTLATYRAVDARRVYYLSAEFLLGRTLRSNLENLGIDGVVKETLAELGLDLADIEEQEPDAGLGNGGLGRLAACFLDSLATIGIPAMGYGIRYEYGIFEQAIRNGAQVEKPDEWLRFGNPWEMERPELACRVKFEGKTQRYVDKNGGSRVSWIDTHDVIGMPYDTPIVGEGRQNVNTLRLWSAKASEEFDLDVFNSGDYERAVYDKTRSETISKVLYPNDSVQVGRELRLRQQYFFVACSIADILRRHLRDHRDVTSLADKVAIQLNDTHPSIAIPELMRVLLDDHDLDWDVAWDITQKVFAYTNHTLMAEALERWSVALFERLLPRHLEIIYEVNHRFLRSVQIQHPNDDDLVRRVSLIEEHPQGKNVRMANLAVVGSHSVNGVAELHTRLLKEDVLKDFADLYPERFNNKTNGVTPRRWLRQCNPRLSAVITRRIGPGWVRNLDELEKLSAFEHDLDAAAQIASVKATNKREFAAFLAKHERITVDPTSIFDVQVKRIHEYKRQLLNVLGVVALWLRARQRQAPPRHPQTFFIGGKAAPGYQTAKLIIRLVNAVAAVVNHDSNKTGLALHFLPNYRVSLAERIIPATDVSEQISTAGKEASGTSNMKLSMNGALTLGTLDGANIEIRDAVGHEAFFLFGLTADEVARKRAEGYRPYAFVEQDPELKETLALIHGGFFSPDDRTLYRDLVESLYRDDPYMLLADFHSYMEARVKVADRYTETAVWNRMVVRNIAGSGRFSSDRTIHEYCRDIWHAEPVEVTLPGSAKRDDASSAD